MTRQLLPPSAVREPFTRPRRRIFRLETLQAYQSDDEQLQLEAFSQGLPAPADSGKAEWPGVGRSMRAAGTRFQRVHVCREPLTPSLRYELSRSYPPSLEAGEEIA